jgi:hypothetical protein
MALSARQTNTIAALLCCPSDRAACKRARVADRTLRTWLRDEEFARALKAAQSEAFSRAAGALQAAAVQAVRVLRGALRSKKDGVRLRAALGMLDRAFRAAELIQLEDRITRLEQAAGYSPARPSLNGFAGRGG